MIFIASKLLHAERYVDMRTEISYRIVDSRTERFAEHTHDYSELFIMLAGTARHTVNDVTTFLHSGDMVFIRPQDVHRYGKCDGEFSFLNITFTMSTLKEAFDYLGEGFPSLAMMNAPLPPTATMIVAELRRLDSRLKLIGAMSPEDHNGRKTALRILLMELMSTNFSDYSPRTDKLPSWLDELCLRMREDGNFALGADRMIELSGKSREHLSRSVKRYLGMTLSAYINELRLNYIANMLINSNRKIADIVFESGFNTMSLATELFRKKYGMNMSAFRSASVK